SPLHTNRLILLSDGQANAGETKRIVLSKESFKARELGITTSTIGIGNDFEEDILAALASESGGRFWYIQESRIEDIIKEEFEGALSVILERPRVKIELPDGIKIVKELNDLKKISGKYRIRPIVNIFNFAFRLEIDPDLISSDNFIVKALLYDGDEVISEVERVILIRSFEEYVTSEENFVVKSIVQQYNSSKTDEALLEKIGEGGTDFSTMHEMIIRDTEAIRVITQSLDNEENKTSKDLARESLYLETRMSQQTGLLETIIRLCEIDDNLPKRKGSETRIFDYLKRWKKLLKFSAHDAQGRFYGNKNDNSIHLELVQEALRIADDLIRDYPERKDLIDIRTELNGHLERYQ
ncbi:MAG TPA: hypothetical protein VEP90_16460, partial [Methylomirabilota bacterium]|nr:hypothetical protein [Methylomirabilota bacterium]